MRNLAIPLLVLLPSLATIAHAAQNGRQWGPARAGQERALTEREKSVTYAGCRQIRALGIAPLRRG